MEPGDIVKVSFDSHSQELLVVSKKEIAIINGQEFIIYHFATGHVLFVKKTFCISNCINIKGHLIDSKKEIKNDDFYLKINKKSALPL